MDNTGTYEIEVCSLCFNLKPKGPPSPKMSIRKMCLKCRHELQEDWPEDEVTHVDVLTEDEALSILATG
jgi:hypothetical protein